MDTIGKTIGVVLILMFWCVVFVLIIAGYFMPTIIAIVRKHCLVAKRLIETYKEKRAPSF